MQSDQSISALEKELLKKYVVQLYETLLDEGKSKQSTKEAKSVSKDPVIVDSTPVVQEVVEVDEVIVEAKPAVPTSVAATPPIVEERPAYTAPAVPSVQTASAPVHTQAPVTEVLINKLDIPNDLKEIFERETAVELSDRLSNTRVKEISSAMGINEKIFTIQELFGGDQKLFSSVTSNLDACKSYDEAVNLLSSTVARDQKWGDASKVKKAKTFMKLVQRKFA